MGRLAGARDAGSSGAAIPALPSATIPTVNCLPLAAGCDIISSSAGGAVGVKGLNAVDSAKQPGNVLQQDIEPSDQGLCAGNGYVAEANNIGEMKIFNHALTQGSSVIPLDTVMGLTKRHWSTAP